MIKIFNWLCVLSILLMAATISSYQLPDSVKKSQLPLIVSQKITEDVNEYYAERMRICKLDALTKAEDFVDSIIVNKISLTVLKGVTFPIRPDRPESPGDIKLDDTTKILPVLKK